MEDNKVLFSDLLRVPTGDKLHIGGLEARQGWKILNIQPGPGVDYVGNIRNLAQFQDGEFSAIYGSHVLEHVGYQKELLGVLTEIHRVLTPGGKLFVSVPDLDTLCRLFVHEQATAKDRFFIMRMMFGGQTDEHDFHHVGLNRESLGNYLYRAGFRNIYRVPEFNLFNDTSSMQYLGVPISLNMVAIKNTIQHT